MLNELSKIGFGGYRISSDLKEHYEVLSYALRLGCNVIDTSSTYMNGKSEKLVGRVLNENPNSESFIITKAGYVQNDDLIHLKHLNNNNKAKDDVVHISDDFKYSIHPEYLDDQIERSIIRLGKIPIDGFLLHNPEHYFDQKNSCLTQEEYYFRIKKAFKFLEEKVSEGKIRYYGISSNTLPLSPKLKNSTDILKLLKDVQKISNNNHFRLIQFPFNLLETNALCPHYSNKNLIEISKLNKLTIFSNRPLNAITKHGPIRIASYDDDVFILTKIKNDNIFHNVLKLISAKLISDGISDDLMEFSILKYLNDNWTKIENDEIAIQIMNQYFFTFIDKIYDGNVPEHDAKIYTEFFNHVLLYSKKIMTKKANNLKEEFLKKGILRDELKSLSALACQNYIDNGIDHVLVGMRKIKYVNDMKIFF